MTARGLTDITIDRALRDKALLGAALGAFATWAAWLAILAAAFGCALTPEQVEAFADVAGGRQLPTHVVRELWIIAGRRSGKSRMAAAVLVFLALFRRHKLAAGEQGFVLCLSASRPQADLIFRYALAFIQESSVLRKELISSSSEEIVLRGGVTIAVHTNSFRTVRGRTLLACVFDEVAFWRDETSATPDLEVYRAVIPSLAASGGMLIGISSPYRRIGLLATKHRDHFGQDDPDVMVVQSPTALLNPTIDLGIIEKASQDDAEAAESEWLGNFRNDLSSFLDDAVIDSAIEHGRPHELPPRQGLKYFCFVDPSGGRHDAFCCAVAHREGDRVIIDLVRGRSPPFDPQQVAGEYVDLAQSYGVRTLTGDNYAAAWVSETFKRAGASFDAAKFPKSKIYLNVLPLFSRGLISIPDHPKLLRELRLLERRVHRSGADSVDHGQGGGDDYANAMAGAAWLASGNPGGRRGGGGQGPGLSCYASPNPQPMYEPSSGLRTFTNRKGEKVVLGATWNSEIARSRSKK
jgi:Terminase large subunit, T4likevirus-type, N-terminal